MISAWLLILGFWGMLLFLGLTVGVVGLMVLQEMREDCDAFCFRWSERIATAAMGVITLTVLSLISSVLMRLCGN